MKIVDNMLSILQGDVDIKFNAEFNNETCEWSYWFDLIVKHKYLRTKLDIDSDIMQIDDKCLINVRLCQVNNDGDLEKLTDGIPTFQTKGIIVAGVMDAINKYFMENRNSELGNNIFNDSGIPRESIIIKYVD